MTASPTWSTLASSIRPPSTRRPGSGSTIVCHAVLMVPTPSNPTTKATCGSPSVSLVKWRSSISRPRSTPSSPALNPRRSVARGRTPCGSIRRTPRATSGTPMPVATRSSDFIPGPSTARSTSSSTPDRSGAVARASRAASLPTASTTRRLTGRSGIRN